MVDLLQRAVGYVRHGTGLEDRIQSIKGLILAKGSEDDEKRCRQVEQIGRMLQHYLDTETALFAQDR